MEINEVISKISTSKWRLFLALFGILTVANIWILTNPPFGDEIYGLHNQALFLARSNFNYVALFADNGDGGSCVYPIGVLPLLYGILYWSLPPLAVHVIGHLLNLAALAFAGTLFFFLLRRFCSERMSMLWLAVGMSEPIIAGRMAALDQESVLTAVCMLAIYLFFTGRPRRAILIGLLSCFVKFTGLILVAAFAAYYLYRTFELKGTERRQSFLYGLSSLVLLGGMFLLKELLPNQPPRDGGIFNMGWFLVKFHAKYYYPWVSLKLILATGVFLWIFFRRRQADMWNYFFLLIFIGGYIVAYFIHNEPQLPRYSSIVLFPLTLLLAWGLESIHKDKAVYIAFFFIIIQGLNLNGMLLPAFPEIYALDHMVQERSREFLASVEREKRFAREFSENPPPGKIVCKMPYTQILTMPELRYVKQPLDNVYGYSIFPNIAVNAHPCKPEDIGPDTWFIYGANNVERWLNPSFRPPLNIKINIYYIDYTYKDELAILVYSDPNTFKKAH